MTQTQTMAGISAGDSPRAPAPATVTDVMRSPLTTVERTAHVAAAAYLMKHAGTTALVVLDEQADRPAGIITDTDVVHVVADGEDANEVRISDVMITDPAVVNGSMTIRDAATIMTNGHFRYLPVVDDSGLIGIVDITAVCRALLDGQDG
ncbi:MAG TPA: CBS domain-containing protein [Streptosporangiaceae bacterium]|nr:CBS domain-containing protein [Streptosporangiaceae bacterium]